MKSGARPRRSRAARRARDAPAHPGRRGPQGRPAPHRSSPSPILFEVGTQRPLTTIGFRVEDRVSEASVPDTADLVERRPLLCPFGFSDSFMNVSFRSSLRPGIHYWIFPGRHLPSPLWETAELQSRSQIRTCFRWVTGAKCGQEAAKIQLLSPKKHPSKPRNPLRVSW